MNRAARLTLPVAEWPAADRLAWEAAVANGGLLDDGGTASHHCRRIQTDLARCYGYLLRFAQEQGLFSDGGPPAVLITPELVAAYVSDLEGRVCSVTRQRYLYKAMRVAEYLAPERDWSWLRRRVRRLAHVARPRNKRPRVVTTGRIVALGRSLMERAEQEDPRRLHSAMLFRDGLLLVFLALCPLRISNFAGLRIGRSLRRLERGWVVVIPGNESKTGRPYEALLPDILTEPLDRFLATWRPRFKDIADHLWSSRCGGRLTASQIDKIIRYHSKKAFGRALSPHLLRDCAATTVAMRRGAEMGTAVALLGHRSQRVIDKHYNQAGMLEAVTRYQDILNG